MKKIVLLSIVLLLHLHLNAQITFEKAFAGIIADDCLGKSVSQTSDSGYIVSGWVIDTAGLFEDIYLLKTDIHGDSLWTKTFGGIDYDEGTTVQQTDDGGYIVCGSTTVLNGSFNRDIYLIRTTGSGDTTWTKTFGGVNNILANSVQQTTDGGFIMTGNGMGVLLIKTDAAGDTLWTKSYGNGDGYSVKQTNDGGYIIAGSTNVFGAGDQDVYLIRTDSSGNCLWSKTYGGSNFDVGQSVQITMDGGYIISGYTISYGAGSGDCYLIKTDSSGNLTWSKTFGGISNDQCYSVHQCKDEGYVLTGMTNSFGSGAQDVYLLKTNSNGILQWSRTFGGPFSDYGFDAYPTLDSGYIISGAIAQGGVYLVKTDSSGNSVCNQNNPATITTSPATQVTTASAVIAFTNIVVTSHTIHVGTGGHVIDICQNTGIHELHGDSSDGVSIYPLPAHTKITVETDFTTIYFQLHDVSGKLLKEDAVNNSSFQTDISELSNGIYFLTLATAKGLIHKRILKD